MNNDKYFADDFVHLHPIGLFDNRRKVEKDLRASCGVFSVHFESDEYRDAMIVAYNPEAVSSEVLLEIIRKSYVRAVRVASMLMRVSSE